MFKRAGNATRTQVSGGYVLVKCGKIALVLRLLCTYPVVAWGEGATLSDLLLLALVLATSLSVLLAWDRVSPFISRHPSLVALDILLGLVVFASANTPHAYMGYLGSTAVLIGLFFPTAGQVLLTILLSAGYALVVVIQGVNGGDWIATPTTAAASVILFVCLTYVGRTMQRLQRQVDAATEEARSIAADAALGQERSRMARELHDSLVKSLEGISLQAQAMTISGKAVEEASMINEAASQAVRESRQLLTGLREASVPPLAEALHRMVDDVQAMHGVTIDLDIEGCLELPLDVRYTARKIIEEALINAATHSGADSIECRASRSAHELRIAVRDNGKGFSKREERAARKSQHYGLTGMRERAGDVGGKLMVGSRSGRGTEVILTVPVTDQEEKYEHSACSHS